MASSGDLFLILSNIALLPAIFSAVRRGLLPEATILSILLAVSMAYHFCLAGVSCLFPLATLREMDHFFVYSTLIWIVLYFIEPPWPIRVSAFFIGEVFIIGFLLTYVSKTWVYGVLIGAIFLGALVLLFLVVRKIPSIDWLDLVILVVLIGVGFSLHIVAGDPGDKDYPTLHSVWHILAMLAIYFVLELKDGTNWIVKVVREFRGDIKAIAAKAETTNG